MDMYESEARAALRVRDEWERYGDDYIIAVDFDNTIRTMDGAIQWEVVKLLKKCQEKGCKTVVYTCRELEDYGLVAETFDKIGLKFDGINVNLNPNLQVNDKKIFYNILLDDRAGLGSAMRMLAAADGWTKRLG